MKSNKDINKYAEAIFIIAEKSGDILEISLQLKSLLHLYKTSPDIRLFLQSKRITFSNKSKILKVVFKNVLSDFSLNVLLQLLEDEMILVIEKIIKRVQVLIDSKRNTVEIEVSTASSISDNELENITNEIERKLDKKVELVNTIDPQILGGVKLRVSNTIIDGSIATRLKKLSDLLYQ
jgi:F-type H+-transporting ATPase subunit delta